MTDSKLALGISAIRTNRYLSITLEFGSDEFLRPDLVKEIMVTLKNKQKKALRSLTSGQNFQNTDGSFILGSILFDEEEVVEVWGSVITNDGQKFRNRCVVVENVDTITSNQF
jgi:hypothetical protein